MLPILTVRDFSTGYGKRQVLFNVNLDVMRGENVLITGGNGSGKSTLLKAIFGLLPAWNADARIVFRPDSDGPALSTQPATLNLRKGLGYLPQRNAVFENLTVEDNLRLAGYTLRENKEFIARQEEVLSTLPVLSSLLQRKPEKMSGGERQITALAMVLLHRPKLLLLDEPLAGMAPQAAALVLDQIGRLQVNSEMTLIMVEHRVNEPYRIANRVIRFRLGSVISESKATSEPFVDTRLTNPELERRLL